MDSISSTGYTAKLRAAADFIDSHPDLPAPCVWAYPDSGNVDISWHVVNEPLSTQDATTESIKTAIPGNWTERGTWAEYTLTQQPSDHAGLTLNIVAAAKTVSA